MTSRHSARRAFLRKSLLQGDLNVVSKIACSEENGYLRAAVSLLHDPDHEVALMAARAVGLLAGHDPESARECVRRLLWSMNDESGSCIPLAPEAIGEILAELPDLRGEFLRVLESFAETEPFEEGVKKAIEKVVKAEGNS